MIKQLKVRRGIQVISLVKVILKIMSHKTIQCFSEVKNIFLKMLIAIMFNQQDFLMKVLNLLLLLNITFTDKRLVNIYIGYEINLCCIHRLLNMRQEILSLVLLCWPKIMSLIDILVLDIVLKFDVCRSFSLSNYSEFGKNVITFGADMSSSVHIDD